jgi:predicted pyridoxine 5'-phosphate oxidase superfamily flavin-nucleotide-binding protein
MASMLYHEGNRAFQDEFDSRRLADRLEEKLSRAAFSDDDKNFIESCSYFFIATADASGRPDCSFKGGAPGFVRITDRRSWHFRIMTAMACSRASATTRSTRMSG